MNARTTHDHFYIQSTHSNPVWHDHAVCNVCGFSIPKTMLKKATGRYKDLRPSQVSEELKRELDIREEK